MPVPDEPLKSSLKTVDQPDGAPGTVAGFTTAGAAFAAGAARAEADGAMAAVNAMTGAMMASASTPRSAIEWRAYPYVLRVAICQACPASSPLLGLINRKLSYSYRNVTWVPLRQSEHR